MQNGVGLTEVNGFNRFEITGTDRHAFLDRLFCGRVTKKPGRVGLGYLLNHQGMLKAEATIANLPASSRGEDRVWYGSAAAAEFHDMDWLRLNQRVDEDVQIRSLTNEMTILVLAGPLSRAVLAEVSRENWSKEAFPWLSARETFIGVAPATVLAVSYSGELAYEIHVPNNQLYAAFLALRKAGEPHGLKLFGSPAPSIRCASRKAFFIGKPTSSPNSIPSKPACRASYAWKRTTSSVKPPCSKRQAEGPPPAPRDDEGRLR